LEGRTVLPGLIDAHAHLFGLGRFLDELNLIGATSAGEVSAMVRDRINSVSAGEWINGRGWDQNDWETKEWPTWRDLPGTESRPVCLRRVDGHAVWVNRTTLDLCGITRDTPDPDGGRIVRDATGEPTGVFIDNAANLIFTHRPKPSRDTQTRWVRMAIAECNRLGLTGIHDAGIDSLTVDIYRELARQGELTIRVYGMWTPDTAGFLQRRLAQGFIDEADHRIVVRAVKLYADGALGSRGALLLEPYADEPSHRGLPVTSRQDILDLCRQASQHGFQVCTHAIGDGGNRAALDVYEQVLRQFHGWDHRWRIEHAQVIAPSDIPRFARLGVIPAMQPTHATSDMYWAEARLGPERVKGAYAWRSLLNAGSRIPCGSDAPVESINPLWGVYAAVTRQDHKGWPEGGWFPDQRLTMEEAIRGFTLDAAYAEFADSLKGSIQAGKLSDLTILDRDPFTVTPAELLQASVTHTIVGGRVVWMAE
jgi:hypothetical protein